ncbi:MAG: ribose 5-phosphate isomerase B [Muribaculaceae bacterium]|nr:ribose 5-phosphate isomerase B [Muribaculaceae bacterium]MDE5659591.1 ribose 5-phosphate isomerase B [Muribaculaceae bacterium]MDE6166259.1 ribose 5-phosphate isomerase B [Muribaculaceae bacterium]
MKIGICSDHAGFELKEIIKAELAKRPDVEEVIDFGTDSAQSCDYPDFAHPCAEAIESGRVWPGIGICGSGNGIAMTLNKHRGVRAAICWNPELAELARLHNDANCLVLSARFISTETALEVLDAFLKTPFEGGRHERRVEKIPVADNR